MLGRLQPHVLPARAAIVRPVNTVAEPDVTSPHVFAGADPNNVRIARVRGQTADGVACLVVEDGSPGRAGVGGLPDTTRTDGHIPDALVLGMDD